MPDFVSTIITDVSSSSVAFLSGVISGYWLTILGIFFVGAMIAMFWRLAHRVTGRR